MWFLDNPEAKLIRRTIETNGQELKDTYSISPQDFKDPHLGDLWRAILDTQKPKWNAALDLFNPEVIKTLTPKAREDLQVIASLEHPEFTPSIWLVKEIKEARKELLKLQLQYNLESKTTLDTKDIEEVESLLAEIKKPVEVERETTPLEDKLHWINTLQTPERFIPTAYASIDKYIKGFRPSSYYLIAGRTGNGKTAVALNLASKLDAKVVFYSLEMPTAFMQERLAAIEAGITAPEEDRIRTPEELELLATTYAVEGRSNIKFAEIPEGGLDINTLKADIRRRKLSGNCDIVFIDQLDNFKRSGKYANDTERLADYSAQLRQLARDLEIPLVLLCQINREGSEEPQLVHLKQTGQLEQDAAVVFLVQIKNPEAEESELVFKIAKNRYGKTGKVFLKWKARFLRVEDQEGYYASRLPNPADRTALMATETF